MLFLYVSFVVQLRHTYVTVNVKVQKYGHGLTRHKKKTNFDRHIGVLNNIVKYRKI